MSKATTPTNCSHDEDKVPAGTSIVKFHEEINMNTLQVLHLCKKFNTILISREFRTAVLLLNRRGKVPARVPYEPGLRHRRAVVEDVDIGEEIESDELEGEVDVMNLENIYDTNMSEIKSNKAFIRRKITAGKFFSPPVQPPMLTWNERECIKYLHKQDPVQWDVKTLSESFPATPDTIKKIIKIRRTITPERAKKIDEVVQRNWELLAEGKLKAEPHVLEHMKKFVNRREVLLEQIKSAKFYLPEVKNEHVWNKGEFNGILSKYEKKLEKLMQQAEMEQKPKMIVDSEGTEDKGAGEGLKEKEGSIADVVHEKIQQTAARPELAGKDSFLFGGVTTFYSEPTTLEDLKKKIVRRAYSKKRLDLLEKAILEHTLDHDGGKLAIGSGNFSKNESYNAENEGSELNLPEIEYDNNSSKNEEGSIVIVSEKVSKNAFFHERKEKTNESSGKKHSMKDSCGKERIVGEKGIKERFLQRFTAPDKNTVLIDESNIGKLFISVPPKPETEEKLDKEESDENAIDFSNPVRMEREKKYYDQEVRDIENTEFWNTQKTSKHKAEIEIQKPSLSGPEDISKGANFAKTVTFSMEPYPERINVPKGKRGSGLTFKIKDCYYDDDGEFLYRVPGMTA